MPWGIRNGSETLLRREMMSYGPWLRRTVENIRQMRRFAERADVAALAFCPRPRP